MDSRPAAPTLAESDQPTHRSANALPRSFLRSLVWALPIHALFAALLMVGAALFYTWSVSKQGLWSQVGAWSLTALYALLGAGGGAVAGFLHAAAATVEQLEQTLRAWLHTLPAITGFDQGQGESIQKIRAQYGRLLDKWLGKILDRIWMPGWLDAFIRSSVREAIVDRFIASCEQRGLAVIAPQEFRNWLLAEGVSLGFLPLHNQLFWWRYVILGLLSILALLVVILGYWST
ncbi:MAG: hypothetical protein KF814_10845 [Nitrospiraceae bacterium]|nr:hypothetical protein [Nitrospiraceae bacterium]